MQNKEGKMESLTLFVSLFLPLSFIWSLSYCSAFNDVSSSDKEVLVEIGGSVR